MKLSFAVYSAGVVAGLFTEKEFEVMFYRHWGTEHHTIEETGKNLRMTSERVRQIEAKCFTKVKEVFERNPNLTEWLGEIIDHIREAKS